MPGPGVGLDVVEFSRMQRLLQRSPEFFARYFAPGEQLQVARAHRPERVAARIFAVKEAVLKAAGLGIFDGVELRDVEVIGSPETVSLGASAVARLGGRAPRIAVADDGQRAYACVLRGPDG
jgi:holo-[acyl-carrier protein] synthase